MLPFTTEKVSICQGPLFASIGLSKIYISSGHPNHPRSKYFCFPCCKESGQCYLSTHFDRIQLQWRRIGKCNVI